MNTIKNFLENKYISGTIYGLLIINAIILAILTSPVISHGEFGKYLEIIDQWIFAIFVIEIILRIMAYGKNFPKDNWNIFDFAIISISLLSYGIGFSVLRTFRVLRLTRLVSINNKFRKIVDTCFNCLPAVGGVCALVTLVLFIYTIMGCNLFGETHPEQFGDLFKGAYSLLMIILFFDWTGVAEPLGTKENFYVFFYFLSFFIIITFVFMNMIIAVVYDVYEIIKEDRFKDENSAIEESLKRIHALESKVDELISITKNKKKK